MTTKLKQEFFNVFGIEPVSKWHKCKDYSCVCCNEYDNCSKREGIDLSKYFKNHYDSWGRLYCIEYKGNPLELQNDIKRLQEET